VKFALNGRTLVSVVLALRVLLNTGTSRAAALAKHLLALVQETVHY
jgi:hypothetical protein